MTYSLSSPGNTHTLGVLLRMQCTLSCVLGELNSDIDSRGTALAANIFGGLVQNVEDVLDEPLILEMRRLVAPLSHGASSGVVRLAYGQLTGWLGAALTQASTDRISGAASGGDTVDAGSDDDPSGRSNDGGYFPSGVWWR